MTIAGQTKLGKNKIQTKTTKKPQQLLMSPTNLIESVRRRRYKLPTRKSTRITK